MLQTTGLHFLPPLLAFFTIRVWGSGIEKWLKATAAEWSERTAGAQPGAARGGRAGTKAYFPGDGCSRCHPPPWGCLLAAADCCLAEFPWATRSCSSNQHHRLSSERCFLMLVTLCISPIAELEDLAVSGAREHAVCPEPGCGVGSPHSTAPPRLTEIYGLRKPTGLDPYWKLSNVQSQSVQWLTKRNKLL